MSSSGSGTIIGWTVEARYVCDGAVVIGGQIFDGKWRHVNFQEAVIGVPRGAVYHLPWLSLADCYSYEAAQALRWWFYADREKARGMGTLGLETRLTRHKITYSYDVKADGAGHIADEENSRYVNSEELETADTTTPEPTDDTAAIQPALDKGTHELDDG